MGLGMGVGNWIGTGGRSGCCRMGYPWSGWGNGSGFFHGHSFLISWILVGSWLVS